MYKGTLTLEGQDLKLGPLVAFAETKRDLIFRIKEKLSTVFCDDDAVELIFILNQLRCDWLAVGPAHESARIGAVGGLGAYLYVESA